MSTSDLEGVLCPFCDQQIDPPEDYLFDHPYDAHSSGDCRARVYFMVLSPAEQAEALARAECGQDVEIMDFEPGVTMRPHGLPPEGDEESPLPPCLEDRQLLFWRPRVANAAVAL